MEEEYMKYRQASIKGKLVIAKRFSKFYINQFQPLTKLEHNDKQKSRQGYQMFTFFGALSFGFFSYRFRRASYSMIEAHEASRDMGLMMGYLNDLFAAVVGFMLGHLYSVDYIYKHRQYVIERLFFEKQNNYNRNSIAMENEFHLMKEYPFAQYVSMSDKDIEESRVHPMEVKENTQEIKDQFEQLQKQYEENRQKQEQKQYKNNQ
eukprot:403346627